MVYILSDTFSRINLGGQRRSKFVVTLNSNFCLKNLLLIYLLGFISYIKVLNFKYLKIFLKYHFGSSLIRGLYTLSKNKFKVYVTYKNLKRLIYKNKFLTCGYLGISISYFPNICSDSECVMRRIGGLVTFYIN